MYQHQTKYHFDSVCLDNTPAEAQIILNVFDIDTSSSTGNGGRYWHSDLSNIGVSASSTSLSRNEINYEVIGSPASADAEIAAYFGSNSGNKYDRAISLLYSSSRNNGQKN